MEIPARRTATTATRLLTDLAKRLNDEHPSAAWSVREGLDETLTVLTLQLSARLQRSLATTNTAESRLSRRKAAPPSLPSHQPLASPSLTGSAQPFAAIALHPNNRGELSA